MLPFASQSTQYLLSSSFNKLDNKAWNFSCCAFCFSFSPRVAIVYKTVKLSATLHSSFYRWQVTESPTEVRISSRIKYDKVLFAFKKGICLQIVTFHVFFHLKIINCFLVFTFNKSIKVNWVWPYFTLNYTKISSAELGNIPL